MNFLSTTIEFPINKYATGHFFTLNLRNRTLNHLCVADQDNRKKEHDMRALKRLSVEQLRQGAATGRKVLYAWDKAGIDFEQWFNWKKKGIYFVSLEKENMDPDVQADNPFDSTHTLNIGVQKDQLVAGLAGVMVRRIRYRCPANGKIYPIITTEMTLPPGLLVLIYRMRWNIEKAFDETKNRWLERKSWAISSTAKTIQAHFLCLAHNLALLLERQLEREGLSDPRESQRRQKRRETLEALQEKKNSPLPLWYQSLQRSTQRGVRFIRWIRNHLFSHAPWALALDSLRRIYHAT